MKPHVEIFSLLLPTARVDFRPEHARLVIARVEGFNAWEDFIPAVENHGMAPLFYRNALKAGVQLPEDIQFQLRGLVLRHRLAGQARRKCLAEILTSANQAGIEVILLKGCAVSLLAYPEEELRPRRDIDLLVSPGQAARLYDLLGSIGYGSAEDVPWDHHHLAGLRKNIDGFKVEVEIHHSLFHFSWRGKAPNEEELLMRSRPCQLDGIPARTLSLEDMLWHTYQHMISGPIRLSGVADMVSLAEQYVDEIDWDRLKREHPDILNVLALIQPHSPLSARVAAAAEINKRNGNIPLGEDLQGWSHINSRQIKTLGWRKFLRLTFTPSDWWLYLYFGADQHRPIWMYRYYFYPMDRLRLAWQRIWRQVNKNAA